MDGSTPVEWSVMVVEDSVVQRAEACRLLAELGVVRIQTAASGREALTLLAERAAPDLLICDLEMPELDGIELLQALCARPPSASLPTVVLASQHGPDILASVERMVRHRGLVVLPSLTKPLTAASLRGVLAALGGAKAPDRQPAPALPVADREELRRGLLAGEFEPFFQPQVDVATGFVCGLEALARWRHPHHGLLPPALFLPRVEADAELLDLLTMGMFERTFRQLAAWSAKGLSPAVALNVSVNSLEQQPRLPERIAALAQQHGVEPRRVTVEVTETVLLREESMALGHLSRLRIKGFGLAMDDYGAGFSTNEALGLVPFSELKIDRAIVDGAAQHPRQEVILAHSIRMAGELGLRVVAEGVETLADWDCLARHGCRGAQGYLIAPPLAAAELPGWLRSHAVALRAGWPRPALRSDDGGPGNAG